MVSKTRDLNTIVKVIHASERDNLNVKQNVKTFNVGKTQMYEIPKQKTKNLKRWENCDNGKNKHNLKKVKTTILMKWCGCDLFVWGGKIKVVESCVYTNSPKKAAEKLCNSKPLVDGGRVYAKDAR